MPASLALPLRWLADPELLAAVRPLLDFVPGVERSLGETIDETV